MTDDNVYGDGDEDFANIKPPTCSLSNNDVDLKWTVTNLIDINKDIELSLIYRNLDK